MCVVKDVLMTYSSFVIAKFLSQGKAHGGFIIFLPTKTLSSNTNLIYQLKTINEKIKRIIIYGLKSFCERWYEYLFSIV